MKRQVDATVRKVQEYRRSNATGKHADRRNRRRRTRSADRDAAIKESD